MIANSWETNALSGAQYSVASKMPNDLYFPYPSVVVNEDPDTGIRLFGASPGVTPCLAGITFGVKNNLAGLFNPVSQYVLLMLGNNAAPSPVDAPAWCFGRFAATAAPGLPNSRSVTPIETNDFFTLDILAPDYHVLWLVASEEPDAYVPPVATSLWASWTWVQTRSPNFP